MNLNGLMGNMGTMIATTVAIPFIFVVLLLLFFAFRSRGKARRSQYWTETQGQIVNTGIEPRRSRSGSGYGTSYYPVVIYTYNAMGQQFQGRRINFGNEIGYGFSGWAERTLAKYPVGMPVPVYFNPENPTDAVLERSAGGSSKILIAIAVLIVVILAGSLLFTYAISQIKFFGFG